MRYNVGSEKVDMVSMAVHSKASLVAFGISEPAIKIRAINSPINDSPMKVGSIRFDLLFVS